MLQSQLRIERDEHKWSLSWNGEFNDRGRGGKELVIVMGLKGDGAGEHRGIGKGMRESRKEIHKGR